MSWTIRPGTLADAPIVIEYNQRLALETEGKTLAPALIGAGVRAALTDPGKGRYFVAEEGGEVLGQIMFTLEWSDWRNGWFWWIQSVYVRQDQRRRGIFRALFAHIRQLAQRDPEVIGLRLYVEHDNHAAQQVYAQLGLTRTGYLVLEQYPLPGR